MPSPRAASRRASGCPASASSASTFGVSRTTLREALRALEAQGVIEIRTGSRGGAFVAEPSAELVAGALGALLRFRSATARELAEFRVPVRGRERRLGRAPRRSRRAGRARAHRRRRRPRRARDAAVALGRGRGARGAVPRCGRARHGQLRARRDHERDPRRARASIHRRAGAAGLAAARRAGPELRAIVDAIHAGDDEAAAAAMWAHVSRWSDLEVAALPLTASAGGQTRRTGRTLGSDPDGARQSPSSVRRRVTYSSSSLRTAASIGGSSYSSSVFL